MAHVNIVEHYFRLDILEFHALRSKIMEIEMPIRMEWRRVCQVYSMFAISDAIALIANMNFRPYLSEFRYMAQVKGRPKEKGGPRQTFSTRNADRNRLKSEGGFDYAIDFPWTRQWTTRRGYRPKKR